MKPFKVICKADGNSWVKDNGPKMSVRKRFFGLIKKTFIDQYKEKAFGPSKEEICIVLEVREDGYYKLSGYTQHGWYTPEPFIKLDEFTESCEEIAKKSDFQLN